MASFFDEKAAQVNQGSLVAFGINITSRYAKASELIELLTFAQKAALAGVAEVVEEVSYDSKAGICSFTFHTPVSLGDPIERKLFEIAMASINQFDWLGEIHHRGEDDE